MSELPIRPGTVDDFPAVARLLATAFHSSAAEENPWGPVFEPSRSLVAQDRDTLVAHASAFTRDLTVPGGPVPAAHVTMVGVAPTHRRQRLLTRLMRRQLSEVGESVAVLWASEGQIYPRFGYGLASHRMSFRIDTKEVRLPEPAHPGQVRTIPTAAARAQLEQVYEAVRPDRPGWSSRDERWWDRILADPPHAREGATELRATVHEDATGAVDGYALWRAKGDWGPNGPEGEVRVTEAVASSPDGYLAIWRFLLGIDLTRAVTRWLSGVDDPLLYLVDEPRRLGATLGDGLFVRLVDVPGALAARRYAAPVDVVLEVTDPMLPANAGRWRLAADGDKVSCTRADSAPADLACGVAELGAAYLGGTPLAALAAAGRVRELRPGTLAPASTAFGWPVAPTGIEIF